MTEEKDKQTKHEVAEFKRLCPKGQDPALSILRGHLLSEHYLQRLLLLKLERGDKVIANANLSYAQEIVLVESFDILSDRTIQCLKNLNTVRNGLSHQKDKDITISDVEKIGQPIGKDFTKVKRERAGDTKGLLSFVLAYICANLITKIQELEGSTVGEKSKSSERKPS